MNKNSDRNREVEKAAARWQESPAMWHAWNTQMLLAELKVIWSVRFSRIWYPVRAYLSAFFGDMNGPETDSAKIQRERDKYEQP